MHVFLHISANSMKFITIHYIGVCALSKCVSFWICDQFACTLFCAEWHTHISWSANQRFKSFARIENNCLLDRSCSCEHIQVFAMEYMQSNTHTLRYISTGGEPRHSAPIYGFIDVRFLICLSLFIISFSLFSAQFFPVSFPHFSLSLPFTQGIALHILCSRSSYQTLSIAITLHKNTTWFHYSASFFHCT